jgi:hypothetical protein
MTDLDLERLGDVWRQRPDPAELEELRRTADAVRRRARWAQVIDVVAAITVAGVVLLLVLSNPRIDTIIVGAGAILILLVSQIRQRRVRRIELKSLTGTTEEMLDQAIARLQTTLRHNRFSLLAVGPAFVIGYLVASRSGGGLDAMVDALGDSSLFRAAWIGIFLAAIIGMFLALVHKDRRQRRELEKLMATRKFYQEETDLTNS